MAKRSTPQELGHLLRRAGFGPSAALLQEYEPLTFDDAVDKLVGGLAAEPPADPANLSLFLPGAINAAWLERMRSTRSPLAEKLTLFWHGHFATSLRKVEDPKLMWRQMTAMRTLGTGKFPALVSAISRDPAMIRWLDGNSNRKGAPNENYARELMELFTIGRGNYTERDVRESARAFTGWGAETDRFVFRSEYHDTGSKTVLGKSGNFDGDDVVNIVTAHPQCARFVGRKLLAWFSHPDPTAAEIDAVAKVWTRAGGNLPDVMRHILTAPAFRSETSYRSLVKSPAEFVVSSLHAVGAQAVPSWAVDAMGRMGQTLFAPPSVKGWDGGRAWMSAGSLLERMRFAARLASETRASTEALATMFDGRMPADIASAIEAATGADRVALGLASPEFQLS